MPVYAFTTEDGKRVDLVLTYEDYKKREYSKEGQLGQFIRDDGVELKRIWIPCGTPSSTVWPLTSAAAGVHPDQIKEQTDYDRKVGLNTEYNSDGDAIFRDHNHRKRHLRHHRLIDRDAFI